VNLDAAADGDVAERGGKVRFADADGPGIAPASASQATMPSAGRIQRQIRCRTGV
jgi:hypothetical protein